MTVIEFSNEFDVLARSYQESLAGRTEFNEYEKSLYLTLAQESVVIGLYNGTLRQEGFEQAEELRRYLDSLVTARVYRDSDQVVVINELPLDVKNVFFPYPEDLLFTVYEQAVVNAENGLKTVEVVPVTFDTLHRTLKNPFRGISSKRGLRLDQDLGFRILTQDTLQEYSLQYIRRPHPIILEPLPDGLTINNEREPMTSELPEQLHRTVLQAAVQLAISKNTTIQKDTK